MILVLNCGSQSIKWKLFKKGLNIFNEGRLDVKNAKEYRHFLIKEFKKIKGLKKEIKIIGHRVVHGGRTLKLPTKITPKVLEEIEKYNKLAPLHNPYNVLGIKVAQEIFPGILQFAVFDTGFFSDLPEKTKIYALPENLRKKYFIQRYGFHGISHEYAAKEAARIIKKHFNKLTIITCHLGGGASITAIKNGKAIDTSMGFTPLEGLVMMTRSGNLDPGIILYLLQGLKVESQKLDNILNEKSGIKGICGFSDMRDVLQAIEKENQKAKLALDIFIYSIQKYIGAYFAILGSCDLLIFTGAIGFNSRKIRNMICKNLYILKNTKILAIRTDEELAIAKKINVL